MRGIKVLLASLFMVFLVGCSEETLPPQDERVGFDYFPLEVGLFRDYQVEQIDFSLISSDTTSFQLREQVVDSFLNVENEFTYVLHRFSRQVDTLEWELDSVWSARRTGNFAVTVENNIPLIKLVFPVEDELRWDGNGLNSRAEQPFVYTDVFQSMVVGDSTFDNTITVVQSDQGDSIVTFDKRLEIYGRGIGLIRKDVNVLNFCSRDDCLGQGIIESGQLRTLNLIDHGKE